MSRAALGSMFMGVVEVSVSSVAAVALAVGLAVSGCTGDPPKPTPLGTPTASTSISSSPTTPAAPTMPPEAEGTSAKSAKAFVRYYVALVNYGLSSGDTQPLRRTSTKRCQTCEAIAAAIVKAYAGDGRLEGEGWHVVSAAPAISDDKGTARVSMQVRITRQVAYESPGSSPSVSKPQTGNLDFGLVKGSHSWVVNELVANG
jgi:hypothetical protein